MGDGAEMVSCKSMGFSGAKTSGLRPSCSSMGACGTTPPQTSEVSCSGRESDILDCPFEEGDDVFCAPEESVIVRCTGDGDTQGRPMQLCDFQYLRSGHDRITTGKTM